MRQGIIMAAGMSRRMGELAKRTPKSLLCIGGQPMLERNIEYMLEAGLDRIVLITGYMADRFQYLKEKYAGRGIRILYNPMFDSANTISSLYTARELLTCDSYITTADIYMQSNPYTAYDGSGSFYLLRPAAHYDLPDWIASVNADRRIISVDKRGHDGYAYTGCSHWTAEALAFLRKLLENTDLSSPAQRAMYWDELLLPYMDSIPVYAQILRSNEEIYEFDTPEDIRRFEEERQTPVTCASPPIA